MTKLAVLSDIHGNLPALEAVVADFEQAEVDHVVIAGDLINLGPFSADVVDRVLDSNWSVIRGNHEYYLLDYQTPRAPASWNDPLRWSLVRHSHQQLGEQRRRRIATWPDTLSLRFPDGPPIFVAHGVPRSPRTGMSWLATDDEITEHLQPIEESVLIVGHTHLPLDRQVGAWRVLNPGSVGNPLDGMPTASYLLLESSATGWQAQFRQVAYDRAWLLREIERQDFVEDCGVIGYLAIEEFKTAQPEISYGVTGFRCPQLPCHLCVFSCDDDPH